jgi:[histone H3]-lysine36 N-dimethyltransferase SETMAR
MHPVDARKRLLPPTKTSKKAHKIILNVRKVKLIEKAEILKISKKRVEHIVHDYLDMRKLSAKWVPRVLKIDQDHQRVDDSDQCLATFNRNKDELFRRYITMDGTWLLHCTPEPIDCQQSILNAKRGKTQRSVGKVMASVFWDVRGIIFIDEIKKKLPHLKKKKVLFHQDNAPVHKSIKNQSILHELDYQLLPHPPYSPNLAPSDFYFCLQTLKGCLLEKKNCKSHRVVTVFLIYFLRIFHEGQRFF